MAVDVIKKLKAALQEAAKDEFDIASKAKERNEDGIAGAHERIGYMLLNLMQKL